MQKKLFLLVGFFSINAYGVTPWYLRQKQKPANQSIEPVKIEATHVVPTNVAPKQEVTLKRFDFGNQALPEVEPTQTTPAKKKKRYLHIGFHKGCILEIDRVAKAVDIDVTPWFIFDKPLEHFEGQNDGLYVYNITAERAQRVWEKHKDYFDQFDAIITSDTAPLSRIFLQNDWKKPLIIWVCNRFDYFFSPTHKPLDFPDEDYYTLFGEAAKKENVFVVSYTPYEWYYALQKGVDIGLRTIKPIGVVEEGDRYRDPKWSVPDTVDKQRTVFIYPRLNEKQINFINEQCTKHDIKTYSGRYNGTNDIAGFKGIMYWPYQWSNLCLFEDFHRGLVHFVPSISFLAQLKKEDAPIHPLMHNMLDERTFQFNEWYCKDHKDLMVYYDSWQDLKHKIATTDYDAMSKKIIAFAQEHKCQMMQGWQELFDEVHQYMFTNEPSGT